MDDKPVKRVQMQPMAHAGSLFLVVDKQTCCKEGKAAVQSLREVHGFLLLP